MSLVTFIEDWANVYIHADWRADFNPHTQQWEVSPTGESAGILLATCEQEEVARHLARAHNYYITYLAGVAWQGEQEPHDGSNAEPAPG